MSKIFKYAFIGIMHTKDESEDEIIKILQECIDNNVDINQNKSEILTHMIKKYKSKVVNFLIDNNINIRADNDLPFIMACCKNNIELIKLFISLGVPIDVDNNRAIGLVDINLNTIKLLCEYGADPFSNDNVVFKRACIRSDINIIKYLLELNPDLCKNDDKLTTYAFEDDSESSFDIKKLILDHGANPNAKNSDGEYLLELCILNPNFDECKLLLEYGADVNLCKFEEIDESEFNSDDRVELKRIVDLCLEYGLDLRESIKKLI